MSAPIAFILLGIAMLVATGLFALGWIVPLIIGLTTKRRGTGHPRAWLVTAGIWGGMVLLVGIGILVAALSDRSAFGGGSQVQVADAKPVTGPKTTLRFPGIKSGSLTLMSTQNARSTYAISNGVMVLPAGKVQVVNLVLTASDARGRTWTANGNWYGASPVEFKAGEERDAPWLPPFQAAVKVTTSGATEALEAEPVYVTADGRELTLTAPARTKEFTPVFEALDASGKAVISGSFEYG